MKKTVEELIRETVQVRETKLLSSETELKIALKEGELYQGSFSVGAGDGKPVRGYVVSDNCRILVPDENFSGTIPTIYFGINTEGLTDPAFVRGTITAITDVGELAIPVNAAIEDKPVVASNIEVKALEDFANLAKANFREAFRMFTDSSFKRLLRAKNTGYLPLYQGLSVNPVTYQHLEEFLIATEKKEPVTLSTDRQEKIVYHISESQKDTIYIFRSTWGYVHAEISVKGDFIEIGKKEISSEDFIGKMYGMEIILNRAAVRGQIAEGEVTIKTAHQTITIPIEVHVAEDMVQISGLYGQKKRLKALRMFLELSLRKTDYRAWYEGTCRIMDELEAAGEDDSFIYFSKIYLAYCNEENNRAIELLWQVKSGERALTRPWEKALYLYLSKKVDLLPAEETDISAALLECCRQDVKCYIPLELYLREEGDITLKAEWMMDELEKAYQSGCSSPFLYQRAWALLLSKESLLRKLSGFERQVLYFCSRYDILNEGILLRAAHLLGGHKYFDPVIYGILAKGYDKYPGKELLEAICKYVMKDDPLKSEYFRWYARAVEANIKITGLYEYYVQTRPDDHYGPYPSAVRMYFAYTSSLGERKRAAVYANIIRYKSEDMLSYSNYLPAMRKLAGEALDKGRINRDYAVLYEEFFSSDISEETAKKLAKVIFARRFTCSRKDIRKVIVTHPALAQERAYPVIDGVAYPEIFSPDAYIFLEDGRRRRFVKTVPYELTRIMHEDVMARACVKCGVWDTGLQLYTCHERGWQMEVNSKNLKSYFNAGENGDFKEFYKDKIRMRVLKFLSSGASFEQSAPYVEAMRESVYGRIDMQAVLNLLLAHGFTGRAFALVNRSGFGNADSATLVQIAKAHIEDTEFAADSDVLSLCRHCFRKGCTDKTVLEYLARYDFDCIEEMSRLWRVCRGASVETWQLEEKLLMTAMFTKTVPEGSDEILDSYLSGSANTGIKRAYLTFVSRKYLMDEAAFSEKTYVRLDQLLDQQRDENMGLCALAWLKFAAENRTLGGEDMPKAGQLLGYCIERGMKLQFMTSLPEKLAAEYNLEDKVIVEERFPEGSRVTICYKIYKTEGLRDGSYRNGALREVLPGLFVKEFPLFYDERLEYYCKVSNKDGERSTGTKTLSKTAFDASGRSKYSLINQMLAAQKLRNEEKLKEAAQRYLRQEEYVGRMFNILK